jgi:hypothetical protein
MRLKLSADYTCKMPRNPIKLSDVNGKKDVMDLYNKICNYVQTNYPEFYLTPAEISPSILSLTPCQAVYDSIARYVEHPEEEEKVPYSIQEKDLDRLGHDLIKTFELEHGNYKTNQIHWDMELLPIGHDDYDFFAIVRIYPNGYMGNKK